LDTLFQDDVFLEELIDDNNEASASLEKKSDSLSVSTVDSDAHVNTNYFFTFHETINNIIQLLLGVLL